MPRRPVDRPEPESHGSLRQRLLEAAAAEVVRVGTDSVSLRAIARHVGVSHQAPIHVFGSRRGLLTAVATAGVEQLAREIGQTAEEALLAEGPGPGVVLAIGLKYIDIARTEQAMFALATRADSLDLDDPALKAARATAWSVLYDAVAAAQENGWRTGQPTELVSLMCWSLVQGVAVIYRDRMAPDDLTVQAPEALARAIAELL